MISVFIGFVIWSVLGLTGAGGSIFAVPLLMIFLDYSPQEAIGMSLGIVSMNAFFWVFLHLRSANIQWVPALIFMIIWAIFSPLGILFQSFFSDLWLLIWFNSLVLAVAYKLWMNSYDSKNNASIIRWKSFPNIPMSPKICSANNAIWSMKLSCFMSMVWAAWATGILSWLFWVGWGFIIVPTLILLTGMSIIKSVATSLVIITIISGAGFIGYILQDGVLYFNDMLIIIISGIVGMFLSKTISNKVDTWLLQRIFSVMMIVLSLIILYISQIPQSQF